MNNTLTNLFLAGLLAALPPAVNAQPEQEQVERSCEQVVDMLDAGDTAAEVVTAMVDSGMALAGAAVFAMECAPEQYREALAEAGVGLAASIREAESVVAAVTFAYGEGSAEAKAARQADQQFKKKEKQPRKHKVDHKPGQGSGVSPS
jgi:hypothetical protein